MRYSGKQGTDLICASAVFEGGNLRNAIPREAYAVVVIPEKYVEVFGEYFQGYG